MAATPLFTNQQATGASSVLNVAGANKASLRVYGQFAADIFIEASYDGVSFFKYWGENEGRRNESCILGSDLSTNTNYDVRLYLDVEPFYAVRLNCLKYTGGTINAVGYIDTGKGTIITGTVGQWAITQDSAAASAQTLTKATVTGKSHWITGFDVNISGAVAGNAITIQLQDGVSTVLKTSIANGSAIGTSKAMTFSFPIQLTAGNAANLVISAGGAGCITTANLIGYTQ